MSAAPSLVYQAILDLIRTARPWDVRCIPHNGDRHLYSYDVWYEDVAPQYVTVSYSLICPACYQGGTDDWRKDTLLVLGEQFKNALDGKEVLALHPDQMERAVRQHDPTKVHRYSQVMVMSDVPAKTGQNVRGKLGKGYILPDRPEVIYIVGQGWYGEWPVLETDCRNRLTEAEEVVAF